MSPTPARQQEFRWKLLSMTATVALGAIGWQFLESKDAKGLLIAVELVLLVLEWFMGDLVHGIRQVGHDVAELRDRSLEHASVDALDESIEGKLARLASKPLSRAIAHAQVHRTRETLDELSAGYMLQHVKTPPDQLADTFCAIFDVLYTGGGSYLTITIPMFWSAEYLGGGERRFYELHEELPKRQKELARDGKPSVVVQRIFLLPEELDEHSLRILREYERRLGAVHGLQTLVLVLTDVIRDETLLHETTNFAVVRSALQKDEIVVSMDWSRARDGRLEFKHVVVSSRTGEHSSKMKDFNKVLKRAVPLDRFLAEHKLVELRTDVDTGKVVRSHGAG